jgi:hypothetical protein
VAAALLLPPALHEALRIDGSAAAFASLDRGSEPQGRNYRWSASAPNGAESRRFGSARRRRCGFAEPRPKRKIR